MNSGSVADPKAELDPKSASSELGEVQASWDALGRLDPMFAILSDPSKRRGRWDPQEFFLRGVIEIEQVFAQLGRLQAGVQLGRALDFGCGIGRNTQALAARFESVVGVDIAASMIEQAQALNQHGSKCTYRKLDSGDLGALDSGSFDFVYCVLVLQHMPTPSAERYIAEFFRVLRPGGVLVFQIPDSTGEQTSWRARVQGLMPRVLLNGYRRLRYGAVARYPTLTNCLPRARVERLIASLGGRVLLVNDDQGFPLRYWSVKES